MKKIFTFFAVAVIVILGVLFIRAKGNAPVVPPPLEIAGSSSPISSGTSSSPAAPGPSKDCGGCVGILDNGKTKIVVPTSRITLDLPMAYYDKSSLKISPEGSLGETFGATAAPGDWVRTFEANNLGTSTISVPSTVSGQPDYKLTIEVVGEDSRWEDGFTVVTPENLDSTLHFPIHERFLLRLGGTDRTVTFSNPNIVAKVPNSINTGGFQGVYEALGVGTTTLTAKSATKTFEVDIAVYQ